MAHGDRSINERIRDKRINPKVIEAENRRQLSYFTSLNPTGGHYTAEQKDYAINKAISIGVRAISRLLNVPRRPFKDG